MRERMLQAQHYSQPPAHRCVAATPTPPVLPAPHASAANGDTSSKNLRKSSLPVRCRPTDLSAASQCAAKHPGCTCSRDIHVRETGKNPPPTGNNSAQTDLPSPNTVRRQTAGNRPLPPLVS